MAHAAVSDSTPPEPVLVAAPEDTLSRTILEFGAPVLDILHIESDRGTIDDALDLVLAVWNAHALACRGRPGRLAQIHAIARQPQSPAMLSRIVSTLDERRSRLYEGDQRVVDRIRLEALRRGGYLVTCTEPRRRSSSPPWAPPSERRRLPRS